MVLSEISEVEEKDMAKTKIEWADAVWNPVTGCTPISEGCQNCYAKRMANRLRGRCGYPADDFFKVTLHQERLNEPLKWKKPRRIFVCSMGDLFHEEVDDGFLCRVFDTMLAAKQHIFMILIKRPERMKNFIMRCVHGIPKNIWLGVTAENQQRADERIPILLQIPAAVRFVSVEPMLGPVDLTEYFSEYDYRPTYEYYREFLKMQGIESDGKPALFKSGLDWVICGGETGPKARPMHPDWVRSLRDQCQDAGVPFFFKSWGEWSADYTEHDKRGVVAFDGWWSEGWPFGYGLDHPNSIEVYKVGKKRAGRLLDGRTWDEMPEIKL